MLLLFPARTCHISAAHGTEYYTLLQKGDGKTPISPFMKQIISAGSKAGVHRKHSCPESVPRSQFPLNNTIFEVIANVIVFKIFVNI